MMYTIVGIKRHDYVSKKDGKRKLGTTLYMTFEERGIDGIGVLEEYLNDGFVDTSELRVGDILRLFYNRWGRVEAYELVTQV